MDASFGCEAHSPYAACSTRANSVAGSSVSPNDSPMAGSHSSGYCLAGDSCSPYAACSTCANWAVGRAVSSNGFRMGGSNSSYSVADSNSPYAACSTCANWMAARAVSPNGFRTGGSNSSGYRSAADSCSGAGPTYCCWTCCSCLATSLDGSLLDCPQSDFRLNDSQPLDFPRGPIRALASATSPEHGRCLQRPWQPRRRVL